MTGYSIKVETSKLRKEDNRYITTKTLVDNRVYRTLAMAFLRVIGIKDNKVNKHNYQVAVDDIKKEKNRRMKSEMKLILVRGKWDVIKRYVIKPIQIYE